MDYLQLTLLAFVQGITEFLPISSSAHLILLPYFLSWDYQGLEIDIALHLGSLLAIIFYLRADIQRAIIGFFNLCAQGFSKTEKTDFTPDNLPNNLLAWHIIIATIPAGLVGFFLKDLIEIYLRAPLIIALSSILFGLLLAFADRMAQKQDIIISNKAALIIGFAQILALIPGVSRSGITMTAARFLGWHRTQAARFSMLLAIPIISLSGLVSIIEQLSNNSDSFFWAQFWFAFIASAVFAFIAVWLLMRWLQKFSFMPFIIYRILLGVVIIALI
ncbi:MAG: undecaprenyl-diphosphate phosphatase [Alphaproteobacteria bacterium]|nr:undecaprenyl-diphosphate phosphatase [Alphaproteobacteria bacterium]